MRDYIQARIDRINAVVASNSRYAQARNLGEVAERYNRSLQEELAEAERLMEAI